MDWSSITFLTNVFINYLENHGPWPIAIGVLLGVVFYKIKFYESYIRWSNYNEDNALALVHCTIDVLRGYHRCLGLVGFIRYGSSRDKRILGEKLAADFATTYLYYTIPSSLESPKSASESWSFDLRLKEYISKVGASFIQLVYSLCCIVFSSTLVERWKIRPFHLAKDYGLILWLLFSILFPLWHARTTELEPKLRSLARKIRTEADEWAQSTGRQAEERLTWYLEEITSGCGGDVHKEETGQELV